MPAKEHIQFLLRGTVITLFLLIVTALMPGTIESIDRTLLSAEFRLRGERKVDSSVVILYFSSDDLSILGDLPLKRSYYALLVKALNDLGVKVIGFDIGFTEEDKANREYDNLFCSIVKESKNVVVSGYFRSIQEDSVPSAVIIPKEVTEKLYVSGKLLWGSRPEFPFGALMSSAAGVGHTNFDEKFRIPLLLKSGDRVVPSFVLEVLRLCERDSKAEINFQDGSLLIPVSGRQKIIATEAFSKIDINYAGKLGVFPTYPAIRFLKAYDTLKSGGSSSLDLGSLKGSIVLIGIIAEGRSAFIQTPFDPQFPAIGINAMAIQNIRQDCLLKTLSWIYLYCVSLLVGIVSTVLLYAKNLRRAILSMVIFCGLVLFFYFLAFYQFNIFIPPTRSLFAALIVTISLLIIRHQQLQEHVKSLTTEKSFIVEQLRKKESILSVLEQELNNAQAHERRESGNTLVEDVKKIKAEILQLKLMAEEERPAHLSHDGSPETLKNFFGILYHTSGPMAPIVEFVKMISSNDAPVLILGESGTGKELVANAIHQLGKRKSNPFVAVNCGALTESLLESELFGHEKGAFTGAIKEKPGRFELADGGTIFLDEIGETSEAFQVKLLRVIQEGVFERVGGVVAHKVDVRVITATNKDIKREVEKKSFREDLYYRLNVLTVQLPPLRERLKDLPQLIQALVIKESSEIEVSAGALESLTQHEWKGNIRELQSVLKRAVILAKAEQRTIIYLKDLPDEIRGKTTSSGSLEEKILNSLRKKQFSRSAVSETALELGGLNRGTVSEYFRGECFRAFVQNRWDFQKAIEMISGVSDSEVNQRVEKKLNEFLSNAVENISFSLSIEEIKITSRPKYKNLAQRYHSALDQIIEAYYKKQWKWPDREN